MHLIYNNGLYGSEVTILTELKLRSILIPRTQKQHSLISQVYNYFSMTTVTLYSITLSSFVHFHPPIYNGLSRSNYRF